VIAASRTIRTIFRTSLMEWDCSTDLWDERPDCPVPWSQRCEQDEVAAGLGTTCGRTGGPIWLIDAIAEWLEHGGDQ
jgi:hypothetical protein